MAKVSIGLALIFYTASALLEFGQEPALTSEAVWGALLGAAIGFQTLAMLEWQGRRGLFGSEPNHFAAFLLVFLGGAAVLTPELVWPGFWRPDAPVAIATALAVSLVSEAWARKAPNSWEGQHYRTAQYKARSAGLRTFFLLSAAVVLADQLGLIHLPLWLVAAVCVWIVNSVITGRMWLLRRHHVASGLRETRSNDLPSDPASAI